MVGVTWTCELVVFAWICLGLAGLGKILLELAVLARSIRGKEVKLSIESVPVHIPGKLNITPDALSRYFFNTTFRDKHPDRTLRKRLFRMIENEVSPFSLDGMAADDGHNKLVEHFCSPSNPLFEFPTTRIDRHHFEIPHYPQEGRHSFLLLLPCSREGECTMV